jgi:ABC-type dipeptide/oligopeptide/nickel transport system permease component
MRPTGTRTPSSRTRCIRRGIGSIVLQVLSPERAGYDLPLVAALFFVIAAFIVLLNLIADVVQAALDPRIRTSTAAA